MGTAESGYFFHAASGNSCEFATPGSPLRSPGSDAGSSHLSSAGMEAVALRRRPPRKKCAEFGLRRAV